MGRGRSSEPHALYAHKRRRNIYLACEDLDTTWDEDQVLQFDYLWNEGISVHVIAEILERPVDEIAILVIDRAAQGKIAPRWGGAFGWLDQNATAN